MVGRHLGRSVAANAAAAYVLFVCLRLFVILLVSSFGLFVGSSLC